MKKNRFVTGFAVLAFSTLLLGACGSDNNDSSSSTSSSTSTAQSSTTETSTTESSKEIVAGGELQDGTYKLEEKNYSNGYRSVFEMVVKDGKITESNFDYIDADGKSKQDDTEYNEKMKEKSGTDPQTYIPELNDELVSAMGEEDGSPADVEVITGATHSAHSFIMYAQQLVNAAEKGDTQTIEVDNIVTK